MTVLYVLGCTLVKARRYTAHWKSVAQTSGKTGLCLSPCCYGLTGRTTLEIVVQQGGNARIIHGLR
jgi:hypothetical protein